jgi:hypothetical protein
MRYVALDEHFAISELAEQWPSPEAMANRFSKSFTADDERSRYTCIPAFRRPTTGSTVAPSWEARCGPRSLR